MLLTFSRQKPGMLLNILQYPEQFPEQRIVKSKILIIPRLRNNGKDHETKSSKNEIEGN